MARGVGEEGDQSDPHLRYLILLGTVGNGRKRDRLASNLLQKRGGREAVGKEEVVGGGGGE